jgi:hypothetical protein
MVPVSPHVKTSVADGKEQSDPKMSILFLMIKRNYQNTQNSGAKSKSLILQKWRNTHWSPEALNVPQKMTSAQQSSLKNNFPQFVQLVCLEEDVTWNCKDA